MSTFDECFDALHGAEGNYSSDQRDPGNWTGGRVGSGVFKGTKYGISAASYPNLDIVNLTLDQAKDITRRDYWNPVRGDELPKAFAHALLDTAFNQGVIHAVLLLQQALGIKQDGNFGPMTMAAFNASDHRALAKKFTICRIVRYSVSPQFLDYANSWVGRALDSYAEMVS